MNLTEYKKRFYNLMESELGNVKPLINEQGETEPQIFDKNYFVNKKNGTLSLNNNMIVNKIDGIELTDAGSQFYDSFKRQNFGGRETSAGDYQWSYGDSVDIGINGAPGKPGISISQNGTELGTMIF
jgi:hypothetical protein